MIQRYKNVLYSWWISSETCVFECFFRCMLTFFFVSDFIQLHHDSCCTSFVWDTCGKWMNGNPVPWAFPVHRDGHLWLIRVYISTPLNVSIRLECSPMSMSDQEDWNMDMPTIFLVVILEEFRLKFVVPFSSMYYLTCFFLWFWLLGNNILVFLNLSKSFFTMTWLWN